MRKVLLSVLCVVFIITVSGCGTIKGLGEDISTIGRWLTKGSTSVKEGTTNTNK